MEERFDAAVAGAGILGLAHAYHLARRGLRVALFERGPRAQGASVRNFGMIWPIGMPPGRLHRLALRSAGIWREALEKAGLWHERCGSLHVAYREDEEAVLREFVRRAPGQGIECRFLSPWEVRERCPAVRPERLRGGMWSPSELCVDPREAVSGLPGWLAERFGVRFFFGAAVTEYHRPHLLAQGRVWQAERLFVCSGEDLETLFPRQLAESGLLRCKLQMMRSAPLGRRLGPHLAAGLTLRHYRSFEGCPSLPALRARVARESPEYDRFGIHVLVSQNGRGEATIGDSHEFGEDVEPFDKPEIDELVLRYLQGFLELPGLRIASRWHGVYVKHPTEPWVRLRPAPGATVVTGVGGMGMTLSFGLAEEVVGEELGD